MKYVLLSFALSFCMVFLFTPFVIMFCRRVGMLDMPSARRINKVPVARGGGISIVLSVVLSMTAFVFFAGAQNILYCTTVVKVLLLSVCVAALGFFDDKYSLPPRWKLMGQILVAFLAWSWAGVGFRGIFPFLPLYVDALLTVFWITGAVNAFNLIDGIDGLATGIALIATCAMGGSLWLIGDGVPAIILHCILSGAFLAFLRYNFNPASVFLGDTGSMFVGFMISILPLVYQAPNSFVVSIGMPLLAMGIPIFDVILAIIRRSVRKFLGGEGCASGEIMTADTDHIHHRVFRRSNSNQSRASLFFYLLTFCAVGMGFISMIMQSRSAGLWLAATTLAGFVVFKSLMEVELVDIGRLFTIAAHRRDVSLTGKAVRLATCFSVFVDTALLFAVFFLMRHLLGLGDEFQPAKMWKMGLLWSSFVFFSDVAFGIYRVYWPRAVFLNFVIMFIANGIGAMLAGSITFYAVDLPMHAIIVFSAGYSLASFVCMAAIRTIRPFLRELAYASRVRSMKNRKDVKRILVYGGGLRYLYFRRELIRNDTACSRVVVGIVDDNIAIKGKRIGNVPVLGTVECLENFVVEKNVTDVVIACELEPERLSSVVERCRAAGVAVCKFKLAEKVL
jgi:UDP-N-acetylmuramyl pentapeptide phosphotransferase/UDP-N-acetylglucosamine-1-phosphate transferase